MKHINIRARTPEGAILRLLDVCNPADIATAVDLFIERLDQMAGDPDLERDDSEDGFEPHLANGPGCPIADPGGFGAANQGTEDDEDDGDAQDGNGSEDDFMYHGGSGPGCPVSDPGGVDFG